MDSNLWQPLAAVVLRYLYLGLGIHWRSQWYLGFIRMAVLSFTMTAIFTWVLIKLSKRLGLVYPPNERTVHKKDMPTAGGLALALPITFFLLQFYHDYPNVPYSGQFLLLGGLGLLPMALGLWDDIKAIKARSKLFGMVIIATLSFVLGWRIGLLSNPFGGAWVLPLWLSYLLTVFWYLLVMNAINLIDGCDGLATGIAAVACFFLLLVGWYIHNQVLSFIALVTLPALLAFLLFNFAPAKIFLGDTGALYIGYMLATASISGPSPIKGVTTLTVLVPLLILLLPVLETGYSFLRRLLAGQPPFKADRAHTHHRLLDLGWSPARLTLTACSFTALCGVAGFALVIKSYLLFWAMGAFIAIGVGLLAVILFKHRLHK